MNPVLRQRRLQRQRRRQRIVLLGALVVVSLVMGVGLSWVSPAKYPWLSIPPGFYDPKQMPIQPALLPEVNPVALPEAQASSPVQARLDQLVATLPAGFKPYVYFLDLQTGAYAGVRPEASVPAASVIKLPILYRYLKALETGELTPYTHLTYEPFEQADGSGGTQYQHPGQPMASVDVARQMIQSSDNTCTNMLIYALGGSEAINTALLQYGWTETHISNWLPDLKGSNVVSMRDMAHVLYAIQADPTLSAQTRALGLKILEGTHNRGLIPALLPDGVRVAHKTGDIGTALGNAALVSLPDGRQYLLAVQVERPYNDFRAKAWIQQLSLSVYETVLAQSKHKA
jgi:beta-lactamase class A